MRGLNPYDLMRVAEILETKMSQVQATAIEHQLVAMEIESLKSRSSEMMEQVFRQEKEMEEKSEKDLTSDP